MRGVGEDAHSSELGGGLGAGVGKPVGIAVGDWVGEMVGLAVGEHDVHSGPTHTRTSAP